MHLLRMFTVRARMIGAIVMVLAIVGGLGAAAFFGLKQSERLGTDFVQQEFVVASMLADVRENSTLIDGIATASAEQSGAIREVAAANLPGSAFSVR